MHLCTITEGIILSYILTTAIRNDERMTPELLSSLQEWNIELALSDSAYDSKMSVKRPNKSESFLFLPINRRNSKERKDAYDRVILAFLETRFDKWLFGLRSEIERVSNELKS